MLKSLDIKVNKGFDKKIFDWQRQKFQQRVLLPPLKNTAYSQFDAVDEEK